jgi:hypothetical protein
MNEIKGFFERNGASLLVGFFWMICAAILGAPAWAAYIMFGVAYFGVRAGER